MAGRQFSAGAGGLAQGLLHEVQFVWEALWLGSVFYLSPNCQQKPFLVGVYFFLLRVHLIELQNLIPSSPRPHPGNHHSTFCFSLFFFFPVFILTCSSLSQKFVSAQCVWPFLYSEFGPTDSAVIRMEPECVLFSQVGIGKIHMNPKEIRAHWSSILKVSSGEEAFSWITHCNLSWRLIIFDVRASSLQPLEEARDRQGMNASPPFISQVSSPSYSP